MQGFRSPEELQRFTSVFSAVRNLFVPPRSRRSALAIHLHRLNATAEWKWLSAIWNGFANLAAAGSVGATRHQRTMDEEVTSTAR